MNDFMRVRRSAWLPVVTITGLVLVAAAAISFVPTGTSRVDRVRADALLSPKADGDDEMKPGQNAEAKIGANEERNPNVSPQVLDYLLRAYPEKDIPTDAQFAAQAGWSVLNADAHSGGGWRLIGPSRSIQPGVLNFFSGGTAPYLTAGRVTAMAMGASCTSRSCVIYVAAAGGGVWRTRNGLSSHPDWRFLSGSFGTNAMGSLLIDPNDTSGNTIYAGTGEPNASGDSEAGVGIYKSTDGGNNWSLVAGSDIFFQRSIGQLALDNDGNLLVPIASGVRGISSSDGAVSSGSTDHPLVTRGLYRQSGNAFTLLWPSPAPVRGSTTVKVDPTHPGIIYVNAFQQGIWRSLDNGTSFSQIFTPQDPTVAGSATDRSEFDVTSLAGGATRMYVGEGQGGGAGHHSNFFRSDNVDTTATFTSMGGVQVDNYCTGQCWYDNVVYTPAGHPDIVYLMGSFDYGSVNFFNNGRGILLSSDGGATWSDVTRDSTNPNATGTHPDQHAIVVNPNNPYQFWEGSDGGVIRSDGRFADISAQCDTRGLDPAGTAYCKSLLWRVPKKLTSMNDGFSTLQFQSLSVSRQNPQNNLQAGTQDNGTWQFRGNTVLWLQEIYGDGGQSGFASSNDHLRFNTFTGQENDVNFQDGDPTKWVIASGPIITSPEAAYFYPPVIADPHPANPQTIFQGSFSVWRTQDWGGNQAFLEANCPEFTTSATTPTCGDFVTIGPPGQTDLVDSGTYGPPVYGADRIGGAVSVLQRSTSSRDRGTMWVATGPGRIFITKNANDAADQVQWTRIDNTSAVSPSRFPSGIYVDSKNKNHAWVSYSGYNVNTPTTPGHVFDVTWNGTVATFTDISYNLPDFPITSIVRDDETGDLYASSDFGVMRLGRRSSNWTVAGSGLPMVEVPNLQIVPGARLLYAATHGRSAWVLRLPED